MIGEAGIVGVLTAALEVITCPAAVPTACDSWLKSFWEGRSQAVQVLCSSSLAGYFTPGNMFCKMRIWLLTLTVSAMSLIELPFEACREGDWLDCSDAIGERTRFVASLSRTSVCFDLKNMALLPRGRGLIGLSAAEVKLKCFPPEKLWYLPRGLFSCETWGTKLKTNDLLAEVFYDSTGWSQLPSRH